jgi:gluconolactonase
MRRVQLHQFQDFALPNKDEAIASNSLARRGFLAGAVGTAALGAMPSHVLARNFGPGAEPSRYPEPDVVVLDKRFKAKVGNTPIQRLWTGALWAEGPAWSEVGRYLLFSDIPNNRQLRYLEEDGHVSESFRVPSNNSNGNTFDYRGRQISFEHLTRRVVRYEHDGDVTVLADKFEGEELNAPNDGMVHPDDGSIWFTDPGYGWLGAYEGGTAATGSPRPYIKEAIYRIDGETGAVEKVADEPFKPNGMCFSHDYKKVYVADTGVTHYPEAKSIVWQYDLDGRKLKNPRTFCSMEMDGKTGLGDGIRCDVDGNLWVGVGWVGEGYDGVHIFAPDGARIGQIRMPEIVANLCFGGQNRNRLFMTGSQSLYAVYVGTRGAHIT